MAMRNLSLFLLLFSYSHGEIPIKNRILLTTFGKPYVAGTLKEHLLYIKTLKVSNNSEASRLKPSGRSTY